MKNILIALIAMLAMFSHAASFKWSSSNPVSFGGKAAEGTATGYLVYLGAETSLDSLFSVDYTEPGTITPASAVQTAISGSGRAAGIVSATYKDTETGVDGHHVATGAHFAMYLVLTDTDGNKWFNFSDTVATITTDATGAFEAKSFAFDFTKNTTIAEAGQTVSAGGGWYNMAIPVPEPATGALALAGIALLLKRRKAAKA